MQNDVSDKKYTVKFYAIKFSAQETGTTKCEVKEMPNEAELDYRTIIEPYRNVTGGIIEALHALVAKYHFIPPKSLKELSKAFRLTEAEIYGVLSFYSYFTVEERGRYVIRVCKSAPCHMENAEGVMELLIRELGIQPGETTEDGKFSLEWTECVGQCAHAPVCTINRDPITDEKTLANIPTLLGHLRQN